MDSQLYIHFSEFQKFYTDHFEFTKASLFFYFNDATSILLYWNSREVKSNTSQN